MGTPAPLQVIADGTESSSASIGFSYALMIVMEYSQNIVLEAMLQHGGISMPARVAPQVRVWYNPELKSRNFMVPGVLGLLLMVMTMILTSLAIVKEKELGTLEQLIVTPIRPYQLIIGKLAPFFVIGVIDVVLVILVALLVFALPVKGGILLLIALSIVFLMTTLGLGLFISTISRTQQQAMMTAIFFLHAAYDLFLRICFSDRKHAPGYSGRFLFDTAALLFCHCQRSFPERIGLDVLWTQAAALLALGTLILSMSVLRFQKRIS